MDRLPPPGPKRDASRAATHPTRAARAATAATEGSAGGAPPARATPRGDPGKLPSADLPVTPSDTVVRHARAARDPAAPPPLHAALRRGAGGGATLGGAREPGISAHAARAANTTGRAQAAAHGADGATTRARAAAMRTAATGAPTADPAAATARVAAAAAQAYHAVDEQVEELGHVPKAAMRAGMKPLLEQVAALAAHASYVPPADLTRAATAIDSLVRRSASQGARLGPTSNTRVALQFFARYLAAAAYARTPTAAPETLLGAAIVRRRNNSGRPQPVQWHVARMNGSTLNLSGDGVLLPMPTAPPGGAPELRASLGQHLAAHDDRAAQIAFLASWLG